MILSALVLRPARRAPLRFLATVAGVAIGVASVVATVLASRAAVASLSEGVEAIAGPVALEVRRPGGVDEGALGRLAEFGDRVLLAPVIEELAELPALGDLVRVLGIDLLLDPGTRGVRPLGREAGPRELPREALLGAGVLLPAELARELAAGEGDALELLARTRRVELILAGTFEPERFPSAWRRVVLIDVALAQELFGRLGSLDRIEVLPRRALEGGPGLDAAELAELRSDLQAALGAGYEVEPPSERRAQTARMLAALDFNLTALSGISILVAIVLVATTLATAVVQRRYELAQARSLGASRAQLGLAIAAEAAAIGLLGGALGALGGWLGARAALAGVRGTVAAVVEGALPGEVRLGALLFALALALGLGAGLVAALLPLREVLATPPLQGLREGRPAPLGRRGLARRGAALGILLGAAALLANLPALGDRPVFALGAALALLASLAVLAAPAIELVGRLHGNLVGHGRAPWLRVAQAALAAGRERGAWAATAVGVAVALAVSMTTMIGSFRATVEDWTRQAMRADLFLRPAPSAAGLSSGRLDPEIVAAARELFGAGNVDAYHAADTRVEGLEVALGGAELAVVARAGGVPFVDGRPPGEVYAEALERGGALVNEPFARRFAVGRGARIRLETPGGTIEREVVGVFLDYSSHTGRVVLDRADFLGRYPDEGPRNAAIFLGEDANPAAARARLLERLGGRFALEVVDSGEIRREILAIFDRTFAVTRALQAVALVVALLAVLTVLFALVDERRGELALVRVLGGSRAQVHGVVLAQAGLLGLVGAAGGLLVGLVVGWVLVKVVNVQSFGWSLRFEPPWASVLGAAAAVLPAALAAGILPSLFAARRTPVEVLRDDA